MKKCHFGFARKTTSELTLNSVPESIHARRTLRKNRLYDLSRDASEGNINDYNAEILLAWHGNMDIQYIGENSTALTMYILKYALKPEKSFATTDFQNLLQNKSAASNLWGLAMRALNNRECGSLEAADTLLQLPLFGTDRDTVIRWVDISMNHSRRVKDKKALMKMEDDETNIFYENWLDDHYPNRPRELESMCLYDFLRWHDFVKTKPKDNVIYYKYNEQKYLRTRKNPYLINHYKYNIKQEPEKYFYSLLLLFFPWRKREHLKPENVNTYKEAFLSASEYLDELVRYHDKLQEIVRAREEILDQVNKLMEIMKNISKKSLMQLLLTLTNN